MLVWVCDVSGRCTGVNDAWVRWRGRADGDELGRGWLEAVHPDDVAVVEHDYGRHLARREPFTMEVRVERADGAFGTLLAVGVPSCGPDGTPSGYVVTCLDVTDLPQTRRWWSKTDDLLRALTEELERGLPSQRQAYRETPDAAVADEGTDSHLTLVGTARGAAMRHAAHFIETTELGGTPRPGGERRDRAPNGRGDPKTDLFDRARSERAHPSRLGHEIAVALIGVDATLEAGDGEWNVAEGGRIALERTRRTVRQGDVAADLGHGEIGVVLNKVTDLTSALEVATTIHEAISRPMPVAGHQVTPHVRIGVALLGRGESIGESLRRAESAMAAARDPSSPDVVALGPQTSELPPNSKEFHQAS